jgi:hypothetical protein
MPFLILWAAAADARYRFWCARVQRALGRHHLIFFLVLLNSQRDEGD